VPEALAASIPSSGFQPTGRLHHLGLEFQAGGGIRFSRDKFRKIRNIFRVAFRRKRAKLARIRGPRKRAEFLVRTAQHALAQSVRNVALIDYYLKHVTDESQLGLLDRWLAVARSATAKSPRRSSSGRATRRKKVPGRQLPGCNRDSRNSQLSLHAPKQWLPPRKRIS
jgi:hypothetical protein